MSAGKVIGALVIIVGIGFLAYHFVYKDKDTSQSQYGAALEKAPDRARDLKLKNNLKMIRGAIQVFAAEQQRYPDSLEELADKGFLDHIPRDPFGGGYVYDSSTGKVKSKSRPQF